MLSDAALRHLRRVADLPDLTGTRYELREPIGCGGMGTVYRVHDRELERDVAMKVLAGAPDADRLARLRTEARVLARLEHPGIVPVHDVGVLPDGRAYYVMTLVRGARLDALAGELGTVPERLRLLLRVCEAVGFAHARGVVHRDLTPGNVMVGPFGQVLVMDWGIARLRPAPEPAGSDAAPSRPADGLTRGGAIVGTPGFMAPEQARGESARVDERSDVFALGALLAWLLAPGQGGPGRCPPPLQAVIGKATAALPGNRYASADALAADLRRYLDGEAVSAHRETILARAARVARRYRVAILLVLGYLIVRVALLLLRGL